MGLTPSNSLFSAHVLGVFMKEMGGKMAKTRFSEELIAFALRQAELGASVCKIFSKTLDRFLIV